MTDFLNKQGKYKVLYTNIENVQAARENDKEGMRTILSILANEASLYLNDFFLEEQWKKIYEDSGEFYALQVALMKWCRAKKIQCCRLRKTRFARAFGGQPLPNGNGYPSGFIKKFQRSFRVSVFPLLGLPGATSLLLFFLFRPCLSVAFAFV
ncbi:MAG: hypothetical protein MUF15_02715 [Acidobacteria bacterium]|nr:hypothetical protein [Acidobacteriota bacterium]